MNKMPVLNNTIRQVLILVLLIALIVLALKELIIFFPGLLGAITLYILSRGSYFQLIYHRKWKKGWTAGLYLLVYLLMISVLVYLIVVLLGKQVAPFLNHPGLILNNAKETINELQSGSGIVVISEDILVDLQKKISDLLPGLLNDTANLVLNLIVMLFMLYYMLVHGKEMESFFEHVIPLKQVNIDLLSGETKRLVKASALGIPLISLIQGAVATVGYVIFGVKAYVIWGFLTGVFAFFPVIGTMVMWVPLVIYMYASGDTWNASWLAVYSFLVTGNADYISRITLLKKMGHVHPVVTVLGVIVGLGLFGFIGLIFGPLLVSYIILIFKIYNNEFIDKKLS